MESPVRICLGAVLVVNLLLLSSTAVNGNALPVENTSTTVKDDRTSRYVKVNGTTWTPRGRQRTPDVALNELQPKESVSQEHTEKNAKYKHRGRVRFNTLTSTESSLRRIRNSSRKTVEKTTETPTVKTTAKLTAKPTVFIVTPTPEVKKPAQIIDSMRSYKKTKMTGPPLSSTTPTSSEKFDSKSEEEYDDEDDKDNIEKYSSSKYYDSNFYTIPGFDNSSKEKSGKIKSQIKLEQNSPFDSYSTYYPKNDETYNSNSFFDFQSELTTPKNDFFDKKYEEISSSIIKNLDYMKAKTTPAQNVTIKNRNVGENVNFEKFLNSTPKNKSSVFFKNTKEIRLSDNEGAGSSNKELSDVQGTSIYYEMSVLSTETYAINNSNEGDCDEVLHSDPTVASSSEDETVSAKSVQPNDNSIPVSTKPSFPDPINEVISTISSSINPYPSPISTFLDSVSPITFSTQNSYFTTDKTHAVSSFSSRNRGYSKRLNFTETKESPNSVTSKAEQSFHNSRTRKFHYTTPKTKPIWMAPARRNVTRGSFTRPNHFPTTIYEEHFDITDKLSTTTPRPRPPNKTVLTTVSSTDIDPVLQGDISGAKKVVHSNSISDNSIPSLWKRGSTKFSSTPATSAEVTPETVSPSGFSGVSDLEIPPTLTAWALASLRSTPTLGSLPKNATRTAQKNADENELQKVGEVIENKESFVSPASIPPTVATNIDVTSQKIMDIDQNKLHWQPVYSPNIEEVVTSTQRQASTNEVKSERQPAESNISVQSSKEPLSTTEKIKMEQVKAISEKENLLEKAKSSWVPATANVEVTTKDEDDEHETIPPVDATKSTGFESITKLPAGLTTPRDETIKAKEDVTEHIENVPTTTDYEITTIRFTYVPTIPDTTDATEQESTTSVWHRVPTRTRTTTIEDGPITTYRPQHHTSTEVEEVTTFVPETTSQIEVSSQITEKVTEKDPTTTTEVTEPIKFDETTSEATTTTTTTTKVTPIETTVIPEDTTTVIVEVVTEINTEREQRTTTTTVEPTETVQTSSEIQDAYSSSEENSGSNEVINQETTKMILSTTTTTEEPMMLETAKPIANEPERVETTTNFKEKEPDTTIFEDSTSEATTDSGTKSVNDLEDLSNYNGEMTTEASSRVLPDEAGSGAAIAIAVSTIGVIALIMLVGLLLVVRRRGRRGVYAQRCTPVSLDAYSLDSVSVGHRKGNQRLRASKRSYGNPAYDDEVTSHPMQYAALANFALDVESIVAEFTEIPTVSVRPEDVPAGCEDKNRYSNVLPLPETRVPLKRIGNDPTTEYINANYITGPGNIRNYYILCQAPLPHTVDDFWRMIWEQNSRVIVMLTEYMENGVEKCYEYLPPSEISDNRRTFGEYQIILKKREQRDKYAVSCVQLINLRTRTWREITHLWYFWPAKGVPDDYDSVIDFLGEMRGYMKMSQTAKEYDEEGVEVIYEDQSRSSYNNLSKLRSEESAGNGVNVYSPARAEEQMRRNFNNGTLSRMKAASEIEGVRPITAVCASGAGRSGALVALDVCARALHAAAADVPRVVRELRAQRPHALNNKHHYIFLYKVLSEYGRKLMGENI